MQCTYTLAMVYEYSGLQETKKKKMLPSQAHSMHRNIHCEGVVRPRSHRQLSREKSRNRNNKNGMKEGGPSF